MRKQLEAASREGCKDLQALTKHLDAQPFTMRGSNNSAPYSRGGLGESEAGGEDSRAAETPAGGKLPGGWLTVDTLANGQ